MERRDNYAIQAANAKVSFLKYDQQKLIEKLKLPYDETYLYPYFLGRQYRIHRKTAHFSWQSGNTWHDGNSFGEVMTMLDLICDSSPSRFVSHRWKDMKAFGRMFHRNLLEERDPWAEKFDADPEGLRRACIALGGTPLPQGDVCYAMELFDGLPIALQLWLGDEEFPPSLRLLWDENALMYLKYETMYYAKGLILERITEIMENCGG